MFATILLGTNGLIDPDTGEVSGEDEIMKWAAVVLTMLLVCSVIEIAALYRYNIKYAMAVAASFFDSTFSRTVWKLYSGPKGPVMWY